MKKKIRIHDGIIGAVLVISVILAVKVHAGWIWVPAILGALMVFAALSSFCPLYFVINKLMPEEGSGGASVAAEQPPEPEEPQQPEGS